MFLLIGGEVIQNQSGHGRKIYLLLIKIINFNCRKKKVAYCFLKSVTMPENNMRDRFPSNCIEMFCAGKEHF